MRHIVQALRQVRRDADALLFSLCLLSNLFGLLLIYSATRYEPTLQGAFLKQLSASFFGVLAFVLFHFIDVEALTERLRHPLLLLSLGLLLLLIPFGNDDGTGNKSWINLPGLPFNLQPGELVKLSFVLLLALQFSRLQKKGRIQSARAFWQSAGLTLLFAGVILLVSSDMGMLLMYPAIFFIMAWAAGVRLYWFLLSLGAIGVGGYFLWPHLPSYIQMRFMVVFDHNLDPQGKGFQQLRSLLTIGSGQVNGQGYLQGVQTQNAASSALPARHTDFIFSVAGEEFGLIGCLLILLLLTAIILRCLFVARSAQTPFLRSVAIGYGGMLAVQTVLNLGMCLFLAPVIGLTLPFFSYGGSSLITIYIAMGIVSDIKMRSRPGRRYSKAT